jgi:hypothetical protein
MTGSIALDVVIGLVFIYLLYSLLATVICEIIATHLGLRARNLRQAIMRMLEDNPQTAERKIPAFFKHIVISVKNAITSPEGPASCVFYHIPVIKYLGRNTLYSKPSYITQQNFSKAIMEIFRRYGGHEGKEDLEKIQNVLNGALEYPGVLKTIKEEINARTEVDPEKLDQGIKYDEIRNEITKLVKAPGATTALDTAQQKLLGKIKKLLDTKRSLQNDKAAVYKIDEMLNLFGHETRSHLLSLLKDANNDLVKFRMHLEQWFDDTMDRATGWYKQKIQFVLLFVGLFLAVCFNANTFVILKKLSVDKEARDNMVQMATDFIKDPANKPEASKPFTAHDSLKIDSLRKVRLDSLEKTRVRIQKQMEDANSLIGMGWTELPDSLRLITKDSVNKIKEANFISIALDGKNLPEKYLVIPAALTKHVLYCLAEKDDSYFWNVDIYKNYNKKLTKIAVDDSWWGHTKYVTGNLFSSAFWGYLLTAIAISLGAPFWFDMLNKLIQIRAAVRSPTKSQSGEPAASSGVTDPAHALNRKG